MRSNRLSKGGAHVDNYSVGILGAGNDLVDGLASSREEIISDSERVGTVVGASQSGNNIGITTVTLCNTSHDDVSASFNVEVSVSGNKGHAEAGNLDFATLDPGLANICGLLGELREVGENNHSAEAVFTGSRCKGPGVGFKVRGGGVINGTVSFVVNELLGRVTANKTLVNIGVLLDGDSVQGVALGFKVRSEVELARIFGEEHGVGSVIRSGNSAVLRGESNGVLPLGLTEITGLHNFMTSGSLAVNSCAVVVSGINLLNANLLVVGGAVFVTNNAGIESPVDSVTISRRGRCFGKSDRRLSKNALRPPAGLTSRCLYLRGNLAALTVGNTDHEAGVFLGKCRNSHVSVSSLETILVKFSFGQVSAADKSISTVLNVIDTNSSNQVNA